jgi:hypothetical protein
MAKLSGIGERSTGNYYRNLHFQGIRFVQWPVNCFVEAFG